MDAYDYGPARDAIAQEPDRAALGARLLSARLGGRGPSSTPRWPTCPASSGPATCWSSTRPGCWLPGWPWRRPRRGSGRGPAARAPAGWGRLGGVWSARGAGSRPAAPRGRPVHLDGSGGRGGGPGRRAGDPEGPAPRPGHLGRAGSMPLPPYIHAPRPDDPDATRPSTPTATRDPRRRPDGRAAPHRGIAGAVPGGGGPVVARGPGRRTRHLPPGHRTEPPRSTSCTPSATGAGWTPWTPAGTPNGWWRSGRRPSAPSSRRPRRAGCRGRTDLYIHGEYRFQVVDVLITNFHLPRSTSCCCWSPSAERAGASSTRIALADGYRFLSFGDAMIVGRAGGCARGDRPARAHDPTVESPRPMARRTGRVHDRRGAPIRCRLHAGRDEGRGQAARRPPTSRRSGAEVRARQHLPPDAPARGRRGRRPRRPAPLHRVGRPHPHRLRRVPGALAAARRSTTTGSPSARSTTAPAPG